MAGQLPQQHLQQQQPGMQLQQQQPQQQQQQQQQYTQSFNVTEHQQMQLSSSSQQFTPQQINLETVSLFLDVFDKGEYCGQKSISSPTPKIRQLKFFPVFRGIFGWTTRLEGAFGE